MKRLLWTVCLLGIAAGCSDDSESDGTAGRAAARSVAVELSCRNRLFTENGSQPLLLPVEGTSMRFVVDAVPAAGYGVAARAETIAATDAATLHLDLPAGTYTLLAWVDYLPENRSAGYYDITSLSSVFYDAPYEANTPYRDVFCGTAELAADSSTAKIVAERPAARCEVVATDLAEFLARNPGADTQKLNVRVAYRGYLPYGYNVRTGKPNVVRENVTTEVRPVVAGDGDLLLLSDPVFVGADASFVLVDLTVTDAANKVVSAVKNLKINYERDKITTVSGKFLTAGSSSSVEIDSGYTGDFTIDFD